MPTMRLAMLTEAKNDAKVAIIVNTFGEAPYLLGTLRCLLRTYIPNNLKPFCLVSAVCPTGRTIKVIDQFLGEFIKFGITADSLLHVKRIGLAKQRNLALSYIFDRFRYLRYIVFVEDDVTIHDAQWLVKLVKIMDMLPPKYVLVSPERGALLCWNITVKPLSCDKPHIALTGGSGLYIARAHVLKDMFEFGIDPYTNLLFFHYEDVEFVIKLWLMGYKTVSLARPPWYMHIGQTGRSRPLYRAYTEYLDRLITLLIDFPVRYVLRGLPFRLLQDLLGSMVKRETILMLMAYMAFFRMLKTLLAERRKRINLFRRRKVECGKLFCHLPFR